MENIARQCQAAVVFPYYTPAPDKQFPFQFEQTYQVLDHFARNGTAHGILAESFALAGDSVGGGFHKSRSQVSQATNTFPGHMSIALTQMAISRSLPAKIGQMILFNPVTDTQLKLPSYETFKDGPFLSAASMEWMIDAFLPNERDRKTALASPLSFASDEVLSRFPPTTVIVGDVDPLVDEGNAFGRRLQILGVDAAVIQGDGQMHAFMAVVALRHSPTSRAMVELGCLKMRKAFPATVSSRM
jgi:acetyl esterase